MMQKKLGQVLASFSWMRHASLQPTKIVVSKVCFFLGLSLYKKCKILIDCFHRYWWIELIIFFPEWLTNESCWGLFPAKTIARGSQHCKPPLCYTQDLNLSRTWSQACSLYSSFNHYTMACHSTITPLHHWTMMIKESFNLFGLYILVYNLKMCVLN